MSDKNDPISSFDFSEPAEQIAETAMRLSSELGGSEESDSFYEGFDRKIIVQLPGTFLVQSSELSAEDEKQIALATALAEEAKREQSPMLRPGTHVDPVVGLTDSQRLIEFVNKTRRVTIEKLEEKIVNDSTPLMLWKLREFALQGRYTETRAIEIWLNWAAKIASRPKKAETDPRVLKNGALFDATLTSGQVLEAQAQEVAKKPRSKNFSTAGDFIGKFKAPKARKSATPKARKETK